MLRKIKLSPVIICFFSFFSIVASAQNTVHVPLNRALKDSLENEIETMSSNDQKYRWMIMFGEFDERKIAEMRNMDRSEQLKRMNDVLSNKAGISKYQKDSLWRLQSEIDSMNFMKISDIICTYGYPKKYIESTKVATILDHSSNHITKYLLQVLKQEAINRNMPAMDFAEIYDKVQLANKLPELYYVMEWYDAATGTSGIHKPMDIAATNLARAEIGLKKIKE